MANADFYRIEHYCEENQRNEPNRTKPVLFGIYSFCVKKIWKNSQTGKKPSGLACTLLT